MGERGKVGKDATWLVCPEFKATGAIERGATLVINGGGIVFTWGFKVFGALDA